ncbi:MAG: flagellar export protein FliJ [Nitrospirae bacterium CG18_big_fil_WC_8_21_14_2_50_70_55]|nr:flagellar export protein FliJ [Deltaproteobacteria bacterium]OIP62044.1 MAG: flagellar export protein FliJ [Nitrospirae bacterium CG2_30_70_394]PIQ05830.1 MAG: flagellar export protein FliJ [Nitrospirae bacterium CG18_big_fil_WC_8_21_14_2_50_70_55]PIU79629.1 MAG: flagellar export protein FliJ [Nitrospirae bacterium CG06_land_8_20_14_3_00_70_43]PIW82915.1 MAG: flagellar export protein FliJ [Nitrospirae bacterium CG_4_8_14_3_um_filter_70_85]PIX83822.1 MAG: flagellar export protein FliJ [Nitro
MKRFDFRLQTLLDHRAHQEEEHSAILAHLHREIATVKGRIVRLDDELRTTTTGQHHDLAAGDLHGARLAQDYLSVLAVRREEQVARLEGLTEAIATARADYLAAHRDHQAVERLRERDWSTYHAELLHEEQKELDEIAGRRRG